MRYFYSRKKVPHTFNSPPVVESSSAAAGLVKDLFWFYLLSPLELAQSAKLLGTLSKCDNVVYSRSVQQEISAVKRLAALEEAHDVQSLQVLRRLHQHEKVSDVIGSTPHLKRLANEGKLALAKGGDGSRILKCAAGVPGAPVQHFQSFAALKRTLGPAGRGKAYHHIVEQTPQNVRRFGPRAIHNTRNVVILPHGKGSLHMRISGYYSSKQPFTNGKTVRDWLSSQSYQEQLDFGLNILAKFGQ